MLNMLLNYPLMNLSNSQTSLSLSINFSLFEVQATQINSKVTNNTENKMTK